MPLVFALVLLLTLGACCAYGAAPGDADAWLTPRELCWALLIRWLGSPVQRRRLRQVLLSRQAAAARRQPPAPPKQLLRPAPGLCDSCREKAAARQYPLHSRQELDKARERVRQGYRLSRQEVEASWRRAELREQCQARGIRD